MDLSNKQDAYRYRRWLDRRLPDEPDAWKRMLPKRLTPDWIWIALGRGELVEARHFPPGYSFRFRDQPRYFVQVDDPELRVLQLSLNHQWVRACPDLQPDEEAMSWLTYPSTPPAARST